MSTERTKGVSTAMIALLVGSSVCASGAPDRDASLGDPGFSRYQIIVDRAPFGALSPPSPPAPTESQPDLSFARSWQLTSIIEQGDSILVGVVDTETGRSIFLRSGESEEEIELISASLADEEVRLRKGPEVATLKMEVRASPLPRRTPDTDPQAGSAERFVSRRPAWAQRARETREDGSSQARGRARPRLSREEMEARLQAYQEEVVRQGLPPLPVPVTQDP